MQGDLVNSGGNSKKIGHEVCDPSFTINSIAIRAHFLPAICHFVNKFMSNS